MTAQLEIGNEYDLAGIAEAAGQPDPYRRHYVRGIFKVEGVSQSALEKAASDPQLGPDAKERREWIGRIAASRYSHEVSGATFTHSDGNTYGIATDRQSQALTTGAAVQARRAQEAGNTDWSKRWKTAQGFVTMTADDILAMGDAVDAHVQACFDREAELVAMVADGTITESDLESGWP